MLAQVLNLFFTRQLHVSDRGDDLYIRNNRLEDHVKANLIIAGSCAAVRYIICTDTFGKVGDAQCLRNTLSTHRKRVGVVLQHIAEDQVFDAAHPGA